MVTGRCNVKWYSWLLNSLGGAPYCMNTPAALISAGVGVAFFAAASAFYYQPSFIRPDYALDAVLTTNHSKARAAVTRLLLNPSSAQFDGLRSVQVVAGKYVCGTVNAKDRSGSYRGHRAFVYAVAIDFARIDDDGEIAQRHDAYKACPVSEEEEKLAQQKIGISPGALQAIKLVQKTLPTADPSVLTDMASQLSPAGSGPAGTTEQQLGRLAGQPGSGGQQSGNQTFKTTPSLESDWRSDKPPTAWPVFPPNHVLAKPVQKRTNAEALVLAKSVEDLWAKSKAGTSSQRPSPDEIREALRALMAIDAKSAEFPQAWAAFVRLRTIEREASA
ncbi:hypothetical protein [Tardiphaga sp. 768_D3_N2_1]|uniref:hypothetical protein n=1 Tax=Tardiphaga sp. 768_D3_N2_1 TaxID=3240783 RepID=UPI003F8B69C9